MDSSPIKYDIPLRILLLFSFMEISAVAGFFLIFPNFHQNLELFFFLIYSVHVEKVQTSLLENSRMVLI